MLSRRAGSLLNTKNTLIIGYPGRLSNAFAWCCPAANFARREDFDISDRSATVNALARLRPSVVINCAAMTNMLDCERNPELAWKVNVDGVKYIAESCRQSDATFVHFSSDYAKDPVNLYGRSKKASERYADLTIRAKPYDTSHWAWEALSRKHTVAMLTTEYLNPISTINLVLLTEELLRLGRRGIVEAGTTERLSFFEVGGVWAEVLDVNRSLVTPTKHLDYPIPRLADMYMDTAALRSEGIAIPTLREDARLLLRWQQAIILKSHSKQSK